ncbi:MAG TPA: hypothetical protein VLQ65_12895 [Saliniramus sp.]|nr:hypothetical protein [Saliniramus sp.]
MISGREALSSLQNALSSARRDEDRLVAMLNSAAEEAGRLRASQADAYRALARIRLDEISRDDVSQNLDSVERAALELLDRRKGSLARAAETRRELMARIAEAQAARADAVARLEVALEAVDDQRERTQARLESDEAWVAQRRALSHATDVARGAAEKAERSEAEKAEKTRPYEADRLFVYLWKRGYGTPAYRRSGLVRYFDGRVARLIGYDEARPNYFMLNEIPLRLGEHAARLAEAVEREAQLLADIERNALEADGIAPLETALGEAETTLATAEERLASAEAALAELDADEHAALVDGVDPILRQALDLLGQAFAREDLRELQRRAQATPTPEDDRIVARLREIEMGIARVDSQIEETRKTALDLAKKRKELERSSENFRSKGYDDPFGGFVNERVIAQVIGGILGGVLSSRDLEKVLRDGFQRRPPRAPGNFGGGIKIPGGSPWGRGKSLGGSWGGSRGGGGFRTGGSMRGGGGFKTGGKF